MQKPTILTIWQLRKKFVCLCYKGRNEVFSSPWNQSSAGENRSLGQGGETESALANFCGRNPFGNLPTTLDGSSQQKCTFPATPYYSFRFIWVGKENPRWEGRESTLKEAQSLPPLLFREVSASMPFFPPPSIPFFLPSTLSLGSWLLLGLLEAVRALGRN